MKKMENIEVYEHFALWLDALLENNEMPESAVAFNFNLYEDRSEETGEKMYGMQLIAADRFDPDDEDGGWACYEAWTSEEDMFYLDFSDEGDVDEKRLMEVFTELCSEYLENGKYKDILLGSQGVGVGFVDGDIDLIYKAEKE